MRKVRARHAVELAPTAHRALKAIGDRKAQREVAEALRALAKAPSLKGKALAGALDGLRSLRASRDRYRIIFEVDADAARVRVLFLGERKPTRPADVYRIAARVLKGLLS